MEPEVAFGQVLRGLRKRQGLSQERLAHEADVERNYVSLLELGRNSASIKMVFKLSDALAILTERRTRFDRISSETGNQTRHIRVHVQ